MNRNTTLRMALTAVGAVIIFTVAAFLALGVKSLATPEATAQQSVPNPGHNYDQIALPEGTWPNLDADKLDGYHASDLSGGGLGQASTILNLTWGGQDCQGGPGGTLYTVPSGKRALINTVGVTENGAVNVTIDVYAPSGRHLLPQYQYSSGVVRIDEPDIILAAGARVDWGCSWPTGGRTAWGALTGIEFSPSP